MFILKDLKKKNILDILIFDVLKELFEELLVLLMWWNWFGEGFFMLEL